MTKKKKKHKGVSLTEYAALTTYSDLLSLLLTLFVLLFALSEPKKPQIAATMAAIKQHMQRLPPAPPPKQSVLPQRATQNELNILRRGPPGTRSETMSFAEDDRQKIVIGGSEFFRPGSAELSVKAKRTIQNDIVPEVKGFHNRIDIYGHTGKPEEEAQDVWSLGYARALAVMHFMVDECGVDENRFRITSCGDKNMRSSDNPAANRRVEIIVSDVMTGGPTVGK